MLVEMDDDFKLKVGWLVYVEVMGWVFVGIEMIDIMIVIDGDKVVVVCGYIMFIGNCGMV